LTSLGAVIGSRRSATSSEPVAEIAFAKKKASKKTEQKAAAVSG